MACNTAHLLLPELQETTGQKFLSLIETTRKHVLQKNYHAVGLLASPTTIRTKLYQNMLEAIGIKVILPNRRELRTVEEVIRLVIAGLSPCVLLPKLDEIVRHMESQGAKTVISGCTELSVVFSEVDDAPITDPLTLISMKVLGEENDE